MLHDMRMVVPQRDIVEAPPSFLYFHTLLLSAKQTCQVDPDSLY